MCPGMLFPRAHCTARGRGAALRSAHAVRRTIYRTQSRIPYPSADKPNCRTRRSKPMPVTVDHQPLSTETLGLQTVGQVLAHLQQQDRLVVNVLIDGQEPDLNE